MQDAGCRAAWIPSVSEGTFSSDLCTLSGYYKKVLEKKGTLVPTSNTITKKGGFNSLFQVQSIYDVSSTSFSAGNGSPGYVSDLAVNGNTGDSLNPLLKAGWQFCQCVAVAVHGCDPTHSFHDYDALQTVTAAQRTGDLSSVFGLRAGVDQGQIPEWQQFNAALAKAQAVGSASPAATYDTPEEAAALLALANSLNSKLDKCAPVAIGAVV